MTDVPPLDPWLSVPPPDLGGVGAEPGRPPTLLLQSRGNRNVVFGFVAVVAVAALVRGWFGASTTAGRVGIVAVFGILLVGTVAVWVATARNPLQLQVWDDRIVLAPTAGRQTLAPLVRGGGPVELARRRVARAFVWGLRQPATDSWLPLDLFDIRAVGAALADRGWLPPHGH